MDKLPCPFEPRYFGGFRVGCIIADLCQKNVMYTDYHPGNILLKEDGDVYIVDIDDVEFEEFPQQIILYARSVMNFFVNFDKAMGAAFRFGFIHSAGEVGSKLFDYLFNEFDLCCYPDKRKERELDLDAEVLARTYKQWNDLISDTFIYQVSERGTKYDEYYYLSLQQNNLELFRESKEKYKDNMEVLRFEYETYLANSLRTGNRYDYLCALVTLSYAEFVLGYEILSAYYYSMANLEMQDEHEKFLPQLSIRRHVAAQFMKKYGVEKTETLMRNVTMETVYLRACNPFANCYLEIWYWSDFQKQHRIEELLAERPHALYGCNNCGFEGFRVSGTSICDRCGSEDVKEISITEIMNTAIEREIKKRESIEIVLPELNCAEAIPVYFDAIEECGKNKLWNEAITIAEEVDQYLADHPEIKDPKGYVKMPTHSAGSIFWDIHDPTHITKFLNIESQYMKRDCETEICVVLCRLHMEQKNYAEAETYAHRVIGLLRDSERWIPPRYAREGYSVLSEAAEQRKDYALSLEYASNGFFIDAILQLDQNNVDMVDGVLQMGNKYSCSGNYGMAGYCFNHALRGHIRKHGIRHPGSVPIYTSIADMHVHRGDHEQACDYFGFALMILEATQSSNYDSAKDKISEEIGKNLKKTGYSGNLEQWKKECLIPEVLQPFPEDHFAENENTTEMKSIEVKSFDDYVVYGV